eukprot:Tbor_TRINITY_DN5489_c4_g3::TRINITY_DN5489_c4_g3_i2::g.24479::m.24479
MSTKESSSSEKPKSAILQRLLEEQRISINNNNKIINERFIISNKVCSLTEIAKLIRKSHPHLNPPIINAPFIFTLFISPFAGGNIRCFYNIFNIYTLWQLIKSLGEIKEYNNNKSIVSGVAEYRDLYITVSDSVWDLIRNGELPPPPQNNNNNNNDNNNNYKKKVALHIIGLSLVLGFSGFL